MFSFFQVVFPKSDEQRQGLAESVKKILLFRSLDKVSLFLFTYLHGNFAETLPPL